MRIAILGGGQLARMLGLAGYSLGLKFRCLDPAPRSCASDLMEQIEGAWDDPKALELLLKDADCVTFETENVPLKALDLIAATQVPCYPSYQALRTTQDRLLEKDFLRASGFETAPYRAPLGREELPSVAAEIGFPAILKTRRMGYDGKGQRLVRSEEELFRAWDELGGHDLIVEGFVSFEAEGSLLGVRGADGQCVFYPVVKNVHRQGVLFSTELWEHFPGSIEKLQGQMRRLLEGFSYRGVLALEFFLCGDRVIANEMAPRVHNSGHWTQHAARTSQFENHLRALCGWSLGEPSALDSFRMLNLLGEVPDPRLILGVPGAQLSDYSKSAAPGRKLGHVTLALGDRGNDFEERWSRLVGLLR